jgi:hypothetical protein
MAAADLVVPAIVEGGNSASQSQYASPGWAYICRSHSFKFYFMFHSLRASALLAFTGCTILFTAASCSKSEDAKPATTGISGSFTPTNGITTVTATPAAGTASTATPSSGAYSFNALSAGTYTVSYTPASGFEAPAPKSITVAANQTTAIPAFTVLASSFNGTLNYTVNGTAGTVMSASYTLNSSNELSIYAGGISSQISVSASSVTAPGTYPISSGTIISGSSFSTITAGSVVITAFSAVTRRATGTFTATAGSSTASGSFTDLKLR